MTHLTCDWLALTGTPNDGRKVHMVRRHPSTDRIGGWSTPREHTRTACEKTWDAGHVTLRIDLVTCHECASWCEQNPDKFEDGTYERTLDGGKPFW